MLSKLLKKEIIGFEHKEPRLSSRRAAWRVQSPFLGEDNPDDSGNLVGQGNDNLGGMHSLLKRCQPLTQAVLGSIHVSKATSRAVD